MTASLERRRGTAVTPQRNGEKQADIIALRSKARTSFLKPSEVLILLQNYEAFQFQLTTTVPVKPESGSLFLYDSTVLRNFRRDGHNWQLKPNGTAVKESHVELKVGNRKVLDCYYAHGDGDDRFQRRVYKQLSEKTLRLVHYLKVEEGIGRIRSMFRLGSKHRVNSQPSDVIQGSEEDGGGVTNGIPEGITDTCFTIPPLPSLPSSPQPSLSHSSLLDQYGLIPEITVPPPNFFHQSNTRFTGLDQSGNSISEESETLLENSGSFDFEPNRDSRIGLWNGFPDEEPSWTPPHTLEPPPLDEEMFPLEPEPQPRSLSAKLNRSYGGRIDLSLLEDVLPRADLNDVEMPELGNISHESENWKDEFLPHNEFSCAVLEDIRLDSFGTSSLGGRFLERSSTEGRGYWSRSLDRCSTGGRGGGGGGGGGSYRNSPLIDFNKLDSFTKWGHEIYVEQNTPEHHLNTRKKSFTVEEPSSIAFEINDVSPSICCTQGGTKVIIIGRTEMPENVKWGVLFDNVEVPAELIQPGVLKCHAPRHVTGTVTISVTLSNGRPCSKPSQIEYEKPRVKPNRDEENLQIRLVHLLLETGKDESENRVMEDEWKWLTEGGEKRRDDKPGFVHEQLMIMLLRRQVAIWAQGQNNEDRLKQGDSGGLAVIHMAAALGYEWAIPYLGKQMDVLDLPDGRGRTALHWAAAYGREKVIFNLLKMGATPAPLFKLPDFEEAATPADLASWHGHKGIAFELAEKALQGVRNQIPCSEMFSMSLKDRVERAGETVVTRYRNAVGTEKEDFSEVEEAIRQGVENSELITFVDRNHSRKKLGLDRVEVVKSEDVEVEDYVKIVGSVIKQNGKKKSGWNGRRESSLRVQQDLSGRKNRTIVWPMQQKVVCLVASARGRAEIKAAYERHRKLRFAMGIIEKVILRWKRGRRGLKDFDNFGKVSSKPGIKGDKVVVHYLSPEKVPREPPIKKGPNGDWRNVGGKGAGIQRACQYLNSLRSSLSGREQYGRLKRMATIQMKDSH